ncbi:MAG: hypothetical protein EOR57_31520 [Mesorhizobium sp.]|uniref:hypothetical protein n=1 Tax=Mesorhizobium sp. TaxID=1871066 RepID=UPI000FE5DDDB|nr:hypothetical protein [Mesorhizobium sp.]RWL14877.1 MAG: hypothetical protein EOR57_31520 [Mesorhizobium sp.]
MESKENTDLPEEWRTRLLECARIVRARGEVVFNWPDSEYNAGPSKADLDNLADRYALWADEETVGA